MKDKRQFQRVKPNDFCQFKNWYPEKNGFKDVMMNYVEDPGVMKKAPTGEGLISELRKCNRGISEDKKKKVWFATLSIDQYSEGHTIVVSQEHFDDITDRKILERKNEVAEFWEGVRQCACRLKEVLGAERIYVASLCDGIIHLHVHLIPRYDKDKTGFGFMGERERLYNEGILHICPRSVRSKARYLQDLANDLRFPPK